MDKKGILSLGCITAIAFILGTFVLGSLLTDYRFISQTVSEIGKKGSPLYLPFQIFCIGIGTLLILFSMGVISFAKHKKISILPGIFIMVFGLAEVGIGIFASPHPLHNIFGLLMIVGYFSPLMFALLWKNKLGKEFKRIAWIAFFLILLGVFLNLSPIFNPTLYPLEYYGLVQRFLLFTFYIYCGYVSIKAIYFSTNFTRATVE